MAKALLDEQNPEDNEFFRVKKVFDQIADDPANAETVKLEILMQKASELYGHMSKLGTDVKSVQIKRYKPSAPYPTVEILPLTDALSESEKCFNLHYDFPTAKFNYEQIIKIHQKRLHQFQVYEPFFDHVMILLSRMKTRFAELRRLEELDQEKTELVTEIAEMRKENKNLREQLSITQEKIDAVNTAWEEKIAEQFNFMAEHSEMMQLLTLLPQWKELKPRDTGLIIKVVSYCITNKKTEVSANELMVGLGLEDGDVTALGTLPFFKFIGQSKFRIDIDGLRQHMEIEKKTEIKADKKGWMKKVKDGVLERLNRKDSPK